MSRAAPWPGCAWARAGAGSKHVGRPLRSEVTISPPDAVLGGATPTVVSGLRYSDCCLDSLQDQFH